MDEDEEKDSDNRLNQRREVDNGRETLLGGNKCGDCCCFCEPVSLVGVVQLLENSPTTTGSLITGEIEILGVAIFVSWLLKSFAAQGRARANPQAAIPTVEVAQSCIVGINYVVRIHHIIMNTRESRNSRKRKQRDLEKRRIEIFA